LLLKDADTPERAKLSEAEAAAPGGPGPPAGGDGTTVSAGSTGPAAAGEVQAGDAEVSWQRPSPRLLRERRIQVGIVTVPAAIVGGVLGAGASAGVGLAIACGVVLVGLVAERFLARRVASWGFAERNEDLMVRRGVLVRRLSVIPYGRMQFIDITAGPLERTLGLATLRMHTAAAASDARIPGLEQDVASRLRDQLAALGQAQAAGL
jgi:membrane protein YdbS with pleckstrin-like domain